MYLSLHKYEIQKRRVKGFFVNSCRNLQVYDKCTKEKLKKEVTGSGQSRGNGDCG